MRFDSPLRYPGGKASLASFLGETIKMNELSGCSYYEPFAGGAGAALCLLREGFVDELNLNDLDPRITAFWSAALGESERFADAVMSVPLTIAEWQKQQQICYLADAAKTFELGFSAFYLNRCNRSGIILGAAPIGGYAQTGKWRIDARFYRETLVERILAIGRRREQIHISNMDARNFMVERLPQRHERKPVFVYLDPPYYSNGNRLYLNSYKDEDHRNLAQYLIGQNGLKWVMSYDNMDFIRILYATCNISHLSLAYSLHQRREAEELLISPPCLRLPVLASSAGEGQAASA